MTTRCCKTCYYLAVFACIVSCSAQSDVLLPDGGRFKSSLPLEYLDRFIPESTKPDLDSSGDYLMELNNKYGVASSAFSTGQHLPENNAVGKVNVYLTPAPQTTAGKRQFRIEFLSADEVHPFGTNCILNEEPYCEFRQFENLGQVLKKFEGAALQSESVVYFASFDRIRFNDINFYKPTVQEKEDYCRINWLKSSSCYSMLTSLVLEFVPDDDTEPTVTVMHVVDQKKMQENEQVISEMEAFLSDNKTLNALTDKILAFKTVRFEDVNITANGWDYVVELTKYYALKLRYLISAPSEIQHIFPSFRQIPEEPLSKWLLEGTLMAFRDYHQSQWKHGKTGGTIYSGERSNYDFLNKAHGFFAHDNALQIDMAPGGIYFESSIVAMLLDLMGGQHIKNEGLGRPDGVVTGSGTESIRVALKAYRDLAVRRGIKNPEMIVPQSAHPAFWRGPEDLKVVAAPIDKRGANATFTVDLEAMERLINDRTVLLVGSAVNYPYGTVDPIENIAQLAEQYNLGLHVDACMGGFILGVLDVEEHGFGHFDFRLPAVSSISIDTHKYGNSLKGSSVVLFRNSELAMHMSYINTEWEGGIYSTAHLGGSRSVGDLAAPFAALLTHGKSTYRDRAKAVLALSRQMADEVGRHDELAVMGKPSMCFAFRSLSEEIDIMRIRSAMSQMPTPWRFNPLQNPEGLHFCVTGPQLQAYNLVEEFRRDLSEAVKKARDSHFAQDGSTLSVYGIDGINAVLNNEINRRAFVRAGGFLLRNSALPHDDLLHEFKDIFRRSVLLDLNLRTPGDKHYNANDL